MLRIKKNVNLTQLEKFGFKKEEGYYLFADGYDDDFISYYDTIEIDLACKELKICSINNEIIEDMIYNLIEAGLVEKV